MQTNRNLSFQFLRQLFRLVLLAVKQQSRKPGQKKWEWARSIWLTYLGLVVASAISEVLIYHVGQTPSKFYRLMLMGNSKEFVRLMLVSVLLFAVSAAVKAIKHFMGGRLMIAFRCSLTHLLQQSYLTEKRFHKLNSQQSIEISDCDSPDQRVTDDVIRFSESVRLVVEKCSVLPFLLIYYSWKCFNLGGLTSLVIIYAYFLLSSFVSAWSANRLVWLTYIRDRAEGHFRYHHLRLRNYAESIALMNSESWHLQSMTLLFDTVILKTITFVNSELLPRFCIHLFSDWAAILSYAVVALALMNQEHRDDLPVLMSLNLFYVMYLLNNLTEIISLVNEFSSLAGYTSRIHQMLEADAGNGYHGVNEKWNNDLTYPDEILRVNDLKYRIGDDRIVHIPSFTVYKRKEESFRLIRIQGKSGLGKSTFYKVLRDLWPVESGSFILNSDSTKVMFLPQQPYLLANATIRQQLTLQDSAIQPSDEEISEVLEIMGLSNLSLSSTDPTLDKDPKQTDLINRLSPGEQQKLCFARVLINKPEVLFMDESTSYMDMESEHKCFQLLRDMNVTCFWITHNSKSDIPANIIMNFSITDDSDSLNGFVNVKFLIVN